MKKKNSIAPEQEWKNLPNSITNQRDPLLRRSQSNQIEIEETQVVDKLLQRVGMGKYQYLTYLVVSIANLVDGGEVILLSLFNYIFVNVYWHITLDEISILGTGVFIGSLIGCVISGIIGDLYGRRILMLLCCIAICISGVVSSFSPNFKVLVISQSVFGVFYGTIVPTSNSLITEVTPKQSRGRNFVFISGVFTIGSLFTLLLALALHISDDQSSNWRLLLVWVVAPMIISSFIIICFMKESPRFVLMKNLEKGLKVLNFMFKMNKGGGQELLVTEEERNDLVAWREEQTKDKHFSAIKIFTNGKFFITLCLWCGWIAISVAYFGISYVLPLAEDQLNNQNNNNDNNPKKLNILSLIYTTLAEIPSMIISALVIEKASFGRKKSLIICLFMTAIASGCVYFWSDGLIYLVVVAKFFISGAYKFVYPLTLEYYDTHSRITGLGFAAALNRVGGAIMPTLCLWALKAGPTIPFVAFAIFCVIGGFGILMLPYDTCGRDLDKVQSLVRSISIEKEGLRRRKEQIE